MSNDTQEQIREVCNEIADMLVAKNKAYGDSALSPKRIFSRLDAAESIKVRIDDKLSRIATGDTTFKEDTILDLMGYLVLLRIALRRNNPAEIALEHREKVEESKTVTTTISYRDGPAKGLEEVCRDNLLLHQTVIVPHTKGPA